MIIIGLVVVILILAVVLVIQKKKEDFDNSMKENYDYGYPYTYPTGFYPPPNGVVLSTMNDQAYAAAQAQAGCKDAAMRYCQASSVPGSQSYLGNNADLSQTLLDVNTKCGAQFPVKEFCFEQNPSYDGVNVIRGGLQHKPVMN